MTQYVNGATEMLLSMLDQSDVGGFKGASVLREVDRDLYIAEFTLAKRPGVTYRIERTAYSAKLQEQLSAESAISVLSGRVLELVHLPQGEVVDGVVRV